MSFVNILDFKSSEKIRSRLKTKKKKSVRKKCLKKSVLWVQAILPLHSFFSRRLVMHSMQSLFLLIELFQICWNVSFLACSILITNCTWLKWASMQKRYWRINSKPKIGHRQLYWEWGIWNNYLHFFAFSKLQFKIKEKTNRFGFIITDAM